MAKFIEAADKRLSGSSLAEREGEMSWGTSVGTSGPGKNTPPPSRQRLYKQVFSGPLACCWLLLCKSSLPLGRSACCAQIGSRKKEARTGINRRLTRNAQLYEGEWLTCSHPCNIP